MVALYGITVKKGEKEEFEKFQMSIARTVTGARKGTSHDVILNDLNWPVGTGMVLLGSVWSTPLWRGFNQLLLQADR